MARKGRSPESRARMVAAAAGLFGARGVDGAPFSEILRASGAPRGSIYYYFPGGKRELVEEAIRWTNQAVLTYQRSCRSTGADGVIDHFVGFFRNSLAGSECRNGCPLAAVVIGSYAPTPGLGRLVRRGFQSWAAVLSSQFRGVGMDSVAGRQLALTTVALVEGALILSRAEGSLRPLDSAVRQLKRLAADDAPHHREARKLATS